MHCTHTRGILHHVNIRQDVFHILFLYSYIGILKFIS